MLDGDRSWQNLIALAGLGSLALLLIVSLFTVRELLGLWHRLLTEQGRVAVLEASAMMLRAQAPLLTSPGRAEVAREVVLARQRVTDLLERGNLAGRDAAHRRHRTGSMGRG